jgi:hypothetical protein
MKTRNHDADVKKSEVRFDRLKRRLLRLEPCLLGTITERRIERNDPDKPGEKKTYGPYFQWTFKREGKTVTVNLSESQAVAYRRAIDENRVLEEIVAELRVQSLEILEKSTEGVKKRNRGI